MCNIQKIVVIFLIFIFNLQLSFSQTDIKEIEFDFHTKKFTQQGIDSLESMKPGEYFQLIINKINTNLYNIILENQDSIIQSDTSIQLPTFASLNLDIFNNILLNLTPLSTVARVIEPNILSALQSPSGGLNKSAFREKYNTDPAFKKSLHDFDLPNILSENSQVDALSDKDDIREKINQNILVITDKIASIKEIGKNIDENYLKINLLLLKYKVIDTESVIYTKLNEDFNFVQALSNANTFRMKISTHTKEIEELSKEYIKFYQEKEAIIVKDEQALAKDKILKESFASALNILTELFNLVSAEKINTALSSIVYQENNQDRKYISFPYQFKGDFGILKIRIEPKKEEYNLQPYYTEIRFPKESREYVGVGLSFYGATLYDEVYSTLTTIKDVDTTFSIVDEKPSKFEFGIASLLRYGGKFEKHPEWGAHLSIGIAVSLVNKLKPRFAFGGGITYGKKHMFTLDLLGIIGAVDRKSTIYDVNKDYNIEPKPVISKLKLGGALSVGYLRAF